jgi:hypothetical protein
LWHFVAYRPEKALRYVQQRRGLNLWIDELDVAPRAGFRGADIAYEGRWMGTRRLRGTDGRMSGKGFVDCRRETIRVWSMVILEGGSRGTNHLCPEPAGGVEPGTILACLRQN